MEEKEIEEKIKDKNNEMIEIEDFEGERITVSVSLKAIREGGIILIRKGGKKNDKEKNSGSGR